MKTRAAIMLFPMTTMMGHAPAVAQQGLQCRVVVSSDLHYADKWNHTPATTGPTMILTTTVVRNQNAIAYLFFSKYPTSGSHEASLQADVSILKPDGSPYSTWLSINAYSGVERPHGNREFGPVLLSTINPMICFKSGDPIGSYVIRAVVLDQITGESTTAEDTVSLVDDDSYAEFEGAQSVEQWMLRYYREPNPSNAIPALVCSAKSGMWSDRDASARMTSFFAAVLEDNPYLSSVLLEGWSGHNPKTKRVILGILARTSCTTPEFLEGLDTRDKALLDGLASDADRDRYVPTRTNAPSPDALWGSFLATGNFDPVYAMCQAIEPSTQAQSEDHDGACTTRRPEPYLAKQSERLLRRCAAEHELVRDYCRWILENTNVSPRQRGVLQRILQQ